MAELMLRHAATLVRVRERTGKIVCLALEPEPCCHLETVAETVAFFERHLFSRAAAERLARLAGLGHAESEAFLRRHLGVCFDACHMAVEFEEPGAALAALQAAGIRVGKSQIRAGLGRFLNTQGYLRELLARLRRETPCRHLEVETYTWDVLPEEYRREGIVDAVAREMRWVIDRMTGVPSWTAPHRGAAEVTHAAVQGLEPR